MSMFKERPDEYTPSLREAGEWLRGEMERVAAEKELPPLRWMLLYGKRETGGIGGAPGITQWGFQVSAVDAASGEPRELRCFLEEEIVTDDRALASRILDLWMDRVVD